MGSEIDSSLFVCIVLNGPMSAGLMLNEEFLCN